MVPHMLTEIHTILPAIDEDAKQNANKTTKQIYIKFSGWLSLSSCGHEALCGNWRRQLPQVGPDHKPLSNLGFWNWLECWVQICCAVGPSAGTEQRQTGGCLPGALEPGMGQSPLLHNNTNEGCIRCVLRNYIFSLLVVHVRFVLSVTTT